LLVAAVDEEKDRCLAVVQQSNESASSLRIAAAAAAADGRSRNLDDQEETKDCSTLVLRRPRSAFDVLVDAAAQQL